MPLLALGLEFEVELEGGVGLLGDELDVFLALLLGEDGEFAVLYGPARFEGAVGWGGGEAECLGAVEEELPALLGLGWAEGVGGEAADVGGLGGGGGHGGGFGGVEFLDAEGAPADGLAGWGVLADGVDLEGDDAWVDEVVDEVGDLGAVEEGAYVVAGADDAAGVPLVGAVEWLGFGVELDGVEPAAAGFVEDAAAPAAGGGFHFELVAVDAPVLDVGVADAAELDAAVDAFVEGVLEFEDEVLVLAVGGEEGVWGVVDGASDDGAVFDGVGGGAVEDGPAVEGLAVEEGGPLGLGGAWGEDGDG